MAQEKPTKWFVPQYLENSVTDVTINPSSLSDHSIVAITIGLTKEERGPGFWRFNKLLLSNTQFVQELCQHIQRLEKRTSKERTISTLSDNHGRILTNNKDILNHEKDFFDIINMEDHTQPESSIQPLHSPTNNSSKIYINKPFSLQEFKTALQDLNNNKSPGSDGLSVEFYKTFCEHLQSPFYDSIMFALENGQLCKEQHTGLITLIPKKDLDKTQIVNWRPITLLNVYFKIFSKAIAKRLQSCIKEVIHENQTGFIRWRYIGENLTTEYYTSYHSHRGRQFALSPRLHQGFRYFVMGTHS